LVEALRRLVTLLARSLSACIILTTLTALSGPAAANCDITDTGIPEDAVASIDPGGARRALARSGIGLGGVYYGEVFANSGGLNEDVEYDGALYLYLNADMHTLGLWKGLCFHADGFQIHGVSTTAVNLGSFVPVSGIEATPATRLFEIWFEQSLLNEKLSVKFGQIAVDTEFMLSEGAAWFLSAIYGWPPIAAADLPNGGPAYPLSQPAVRVALAPNDRFTLMGAVYNGDPAGPNCTGDPQRCNDHGLEFRFEDPPLLFVEGAYKYNRGHLPGTIKLGGWNHFGKFEHQRVDVGGNLIAVTGRPGRVIDDNYGIYGVIDQYLWRVPGTEEPKGVAVFARVMGAPEDRNLVDFYADMGITLTGMIPRRPEDAFAIGFAYVGISDTVHAFDLDAGEHVARNHEAALEICYTMQIKPGFMLQPDFQYIWQPGGNVTDERGRRIEDAAVIGARTKITF
jgi:porin